jgi:hypothetical protein
MLKSLAILLAAITPLMSHAIEEPAYEVKSHIDEVEIRLYASYVVAEVTVDGPAEDAGNKAFPILAGYIFGKNKGERKLEMTAPVTQTQEPVKMAMTAPVTQSASGERFVVQFVLPRDVTLETAPEPLDSRVQVRQVPAHSVAAVRYSGLWTQANYEEHLEKLQTILRRAGIAWSGEPMLSRYNSPFTPWFMRRNEVWLSLSHTN